MRKATEINCFKPTCMVRNYNWCLNLLKSIELLHSRYTDLINQSSNVFSINFDYYGWKFYVKFKQRQKGDRYQIRSYQEEMQWEPKITSSQDTSFMLRCDIFSGKGFEGIWNFSLLQFSCPNEATFRNSPCEQGCQYPVHKNDEEPYLITHILFSNYIIMIIQIHISNLTSGKKNVTYFLRLFNINIFYKVFMTNKQQLIAKIEGTLTEYPIASISLATVSLILLVLRKYHGRFVVYPSVGGRHNHQNAHGYRHPSQKRLESEDIQIQSESHIKLRGWYIKHPNPQRVVVYFHQNAGNIGGRLFYASAVLNNSNANVLMVAYRGFSESDGTGKPNEAEIMRDAVAIFRKGIQLAQRDHLPLFVFGRSLGGAAAIHVLSRPEFKYAARGLVLQNTFTSICDVVYNFLPPYLFPLRSIIWLVTSSSYKSISKIKDIHTPILFVKGRRDTLVPARLMDDLEQEFAANKGEHFTLEVEKGSHNDTWYVAGQRYFNVLNQFMNHCSRI